MHVDVVPVPEAWARKAWADSDTYKAMYQRSIDDPEGFWGEHGKRVDWVKPYTQVKDVSFDAGDLPVRWFRDGTLNVAANCLDRHLATRGDQTAIIWEGDDPADAKHITYRALYEEVCRFANGLKSLGVKKGDRVTDLSVDGAGDRRRHAGLCAHRRGPFRRVRRLLAGQAWPAASTTAIRPSSSRPTRASAAAARSR